MASIHKDPRGKSPYFYAAFTLPDGRRSFRSTKQSDRSQAMAVALQFEKAAKLGKEKRLTENQAREVLADIFKVANQSSLPNSTVREYLKSWLDIKQVEVSKGSHARYTDAANALIEFLGTRADNSLDHITKTDVATFRNWLAGKLAPGTTNLLLKILAGAWSQAMDDGLLRENAFGSIKMVKDNKTQIRRAFTLDEIKRILAECGDTEWRGLVLLGLYSGQRLGDVARMTWQSVDLLQGELKFLTGKTKRPMVIPLAKPLHGYLMTLPAPDDPKAPLFPAACKLGAKRTSPLSNEFREILVRAGLATARTHQSTGKGRASKREGDALSFHCLRHSLTSWLKNAGVSNAIAMDLVGHDSEAISRNYTHIESATKAAALNKLPDVTQ